MTAIAPGSAWQEDCHVRRNVSIFVLSLPPLP